MSAQEITIRQVMTGNAVVVTPNTSVQDVLRLMSARRIGAVLVGDQGSIQGIFTERDFLRRATESAPGWRQRAVAEWMTRNPHTIAADAGWEEAMVMMEREHVRHLPVIEESRIVGILSARNLIAMRNEHLNQVVEDRTRELQRLYDEVSAHGREMQQNMEIAGRLQSRLLSPGAPPGWPELHWGIHYEMLDPLGGDYYDFALPDDNHLGILIADASGHSIPAAMVAIMARFAFAAVAKSTVKPAEVLSVMNRRLQGLTDERFVTAFFGVLDRKNRDFRYANAGHPPPLRYQPARETIEPLAVNGMMLGILPDTRYEERSIRLEPGDRLCLYTDGVIECRNSGDENFGPERLEAFLRQAGAMPAAVMAQRLVEQLTDFRADRAALDDTTVLIAELTE
ncbi:MAG TPA: SpoIIE family protein phosphatase [Gemmataceae bacterium]|nr:SpoIIE family protein phosphatase [Gemmataceae bacterium]